MARGWWIVVLVLAGCGGDDDGGGDGAGTADAMAEGDAEPPPSTCDPAERQTRDRADEVSGYQIHVVVALPSDGEDRQLDTSGVLAATVSVWNGWLDEAAGGSHLRLDTCDGELDVTFARLTESDADIAATGAYVRDRVEALSFAGSGDPPGYLEFAMLHEIVHTLGMVAEAAPHHNLAGHCDDTAGTDLMYAGPDPGTPRCSTRATTTTTTTGRRCPTWPRAPSSTRRRPIPSCPRPGDRQDRPICLAMITFMISLVPA